MVAYSFRSRFVARIEDGSKRQTMRNERARHARVGEKVQLYTGMRTKSCRLIGIATCPAVLPVRMDFHALTVAFGPGLADTIASPAELEWFARRDGFDSWADLRTFWNGEHATVIHWSGVMIEWTNLELAV